MGCLGGSQRCAALYPLRRLIHKAAVAQTQLQHSNHGNSRAKCNTATFSAYSRRVDNVQGKSKEDAQSGIHQVRVSLSLVLTTTPGLCAMGGKNGMSR